MYRSPSTHLNSSGTVHGCVCERGMGGMRWGVSCVRVMVRWLHTCLGRDPEREPERCGRVPTHKRKLVGAHLAHLLDVQHQHAPLHAARRASLAHDEPTLATLLLHAAVPRARGETATHGEMAGWAGGHHLLATRVVAETTVFL
eukprot:scaffold65712_cov53-Phaeocystis_antarctica.AAC.1